MGINKRGIEQASRSTKFVADQRYQQVAMLILSGYTRQDINRYCLDHYNIKLKTVNDYITNAYQFINDNYKVDKSTIITTHINYYYEIYKNCKEVDPKSAIAALNQIEKLNKLHNPEVAIQNNTLMLNAKDMDINQLKELLGTK